MAKTHYVNVTDDQPAVEAVKLGFTGDPRGVIGEIYADHECWAEAESLRKWREQRARTEPQSGSGI